MSQQIIVSFSDIETRFKELNRDNSDNYLNCLLYEMISDCVCFISLVGNKELDCFETDQLLDALCDTVNVISSQFKERLTLENWLATLEHFSIDVYERLSSVISTNGKCYRLGYRVSGGNYVIKEINAK